MSFSDVIGQSHAKGILQHALANDRVPHAYIFSGPQGVGKEALALEFAKALLCRDTNLVPCDQCDNCRRISSFQHPDFSFVFPSSAKNVDEERAVLDSMMADPYRRNHPWANPTIGIEQIRELRHQATVKPLEGHRIVVITEAERMTLQASNSLLKLLEEPPEFMHLVLITSKINAMLPTILSRCQEIRLGPLPNAEIERALVERKRLDPHQAHLIAGMSQGNYRRALEWLDESDNAMREAALTFLRTCLKNPKVQIDFVEELTKSFSKGQIKDVLSLMMLWFRDALILHEKGAGNVLANTDQLDTLQKFLNAFESIDFYAAESEIENSLYLIDRNVQLSLILIALMIKLQRMMKLKGRQT